jgi:hypothetical protein
MSAAHNVGRYHEFYTLKTTYPIYCYMWYGGAT